MGRFLKITLDDQQRAALEQGYRNGKTHAFRQHCQIVLLKAQGRKSQEIATLLGCNQKSVNDWLHRYQKEGVHGLHIKPVPGAKAFSRRRPIRLKFVKLCSNIANASAWRRRSWKPHSAKSFLSELLCAS